MERVLSNRYEVGTLVGSGGSARVYAARDRVLDRRVAVKMLDDHAAATNDPARRDRFLGEAQTAARFTHPGAVAVYDAGESEGQLYIIMELVDGRSLAHHIAADAPMPEADVVRIGARLLDTLEAAHRAGLVHRDVKPANVLVDASGDAKLADFGIAKRFDELAASLTTDGMVVGSRDYLAPEQAAGRPVTPAVDQYAVGVLLYEMLTGHRPPLAGTTDDPGAELRRARPDVSLGVVDVIARALSATPERRYPSAGEMASDLRQASESTALLAAHAEQFAGRHDGATMVMETASVAPATARPAATALMAPPAGTRVADDDTGIATGGGGDDDDRLSVANAIDRRDPRPASSAAVADRRQPWWMVVAAVVLAVVLIGLVVATAGDDGSIDGSAPAAPAGDPVAPAGDPAAVTDDGVEEQPATLPTTPPGTELIPGFPATDDLGEFIFLLRDGRDVVGKKSKQLGDGLRKVLESDSDERADEADDVAEDLTEWVEAGEIEPVVADRAFMFLALLGADVDD